MIDWKWFLESLSRRAKLAYRGRSPKQTVGPSLFRHLQPDVVQISFR
jgi:hypothetical protein